ncbi:MAG: hypothetical protein RLZZ233_171 [Verrucomicrobiota bacterium]|jgi:hypothetical protein
MVTGTGIGSSGGGLTGVCSGLLFPAAEAERLAPERLTTGAVTRHPKLC